MSITAVQKPLEQLEARVRELENIALETGFLSDEFPGVAHCGCREAGGEDVRDGVEE